MATDEDSIDVSAQQNATTSDPTRAPSLIGEAQDRPAKVATGRSTRKGQTDSKTASRRQATAPANARKGATGDAGNGNESTTLEETDRDRIRRLGRMRPPQFKSLWAEFTFNFSIIGSQFMAEYFVSGFNVLVPSLMTKLDIPRSASVWPSASFALVTSSFLLPFGRFADMYGGYPVYLFGLVWFIVLSIISGFASSEMMLIWCRALQGLGPAAFLPSGVQLLGTNYYRPGPRKNLIFALYGGSAPLGFFFGIVIAGVSGSLLQFGWYFWIGSFLLFLTVLAAVFAVPSDFTRRRQTEMDWLGSVLTISGLMLTVFALTDGSHAPNKWATPYIPATLAVGILLLTAAVYVEGWVATHPLLPGFLFRVPYIKPLFLALFFSYGCLGTFLLYSTLFMTDILHASPILVAAWFTPMCIGGVLISIAGGYVLHLIPGTLLVSLSSGGWIASALLFAFAPPPAASASTAQVYWSYIFPAMCGATIGIDITFNVANVFITTALSRRAQGLAGSVMNALVYLGIALCLAGADITQTQVFAARRPEDAEPGALLKSYRAVFYYMLACSVASLYLMSHFVRIPKAESDLTADEREALLMGATGGDEAASVESLSSYVTPQERVAEDDGPGEDGGIELQERRDSSKKKKVPVED